MTTPALSSTLARILLAQSPLHAWTASPELNPAYREEYRDEWDMGSWVHRMLLEPENTPAKHVIVDADSWRTKAAQQARDAARAAGKIALLMKDAARLAECVDAVREQLDRFDESPKPLTAGRPEVTLEWREGDVLCRTRCDWLSNDKALVEDCKTTSGSAHPDAWARRMWDSGLDVQAAFYLRGVRAIYKTEPDFRFIAIELMRPYGVTLIALDPEALEIADRKVTKAIALWGECVRKNEWPGYAARTYTIDTPPWRTAEWERREYMERPESMIDDGRPLAEQL